MAIPIIKIENAAGDVLDLTADPRYEPILQNTGPVGATINHAKAGTAVGTKFNSSTVGARNLLLTIEFKKDVARARRNLYKYIIPQEYIKVYYREDDLAVYSEGYVETADVDPWSQGQNLAVSIICPVPYWRDVSETHTDASHVEALFEFPFAIDSDGAELSTKDTTEVTTIENQGNVEAGVRFELKAILRSLQPRIYNLSTGEYMGFYVDMEPGDRLVVTTHDGDKTVALIRDGASTNYINALMPDSDWLQLKGGTNGFSYTVDEGEIEFHVYHTNMYTGV